MAFVNASNSQACGTTTHLLHCSTCSTRLSQGVGLAVCTTCADNTRKMEALGSIKAASSTSQAEFQCALCAVHQRQLEEDQLVLAVGGPSPTDLLRTIADESKWFLVLSRATADEKLSALGKLKRQMDHTSAEHELAQGVASHDPIAAFLLQQKGESITASKAMEVYVHSKVPTIKFKDLLLPPRGSMDRARRHFAECVNSTDPLVAALASERDFLCDFVEKQYVPVPKKGQSIAYCEVPLNALITFALCF